MIGLSGILKSQNDVGIATLRGLAASSMQNHFRGNAPSRRGERTRTGVYLNGSCANLVKDKASRLIGSG